MRRKSVLTTACAIAGAVALAAVSACSAVVSSATSGTSVTASPAGRGTAATPGTRVTADPPAEGTATYRAASTVTIAAAGDTMLGSTPDLPPDPGSYLNAVKQVLGRGAQVVFGNLEGTLTTATASKCGSGPSSDCFAFRDSPGYARYLKQAGFTVLNDANNHSFDFGAACEAQTVRTLHAAGLAQTGHAVLRGRLIAYSPGNFAGYRNFATDGDLDTSEILHVTLSATGRFEAARISRSGVIQAP